MKRAIAIGLTTVMAVSVGQPAFADIRESAAREAALAAQQGTPGNGSHSQNLLYSGAALIGAGAILAVYGFTHTSGASISTNSSLTSVSVDEKHPIGVGIAGLGAMGVGGYLLTKWKHSPDVQFGPQGVAIHKHVRF